MRTAPVSRDRIPAERVRLQQSRLRRSVWERWPAESRFAVEPRCPGRQRVGRLPGHNRDLDLIGVELFPKLMQPQGVSPLLQSRVCLFYTFYLDQLLSSTPRQTQDALFEKILTFLFSQLDLPRERKIVSLQAMDTLQTQMNESLLK